MSWGQLRDAVDLAAKDIDLDLFDALYQRAKGLHHDTRELECDEATLVILAALLIVRADALVEAIGLVEARLVRRDEVH